MAKNPSKEKKVIRKGGWSLEEDQRLTAYISRFGIWNWNEIPKHAGLSRTGKSCRLRWLNYLRPDIKRGNISREEEEIIVKLHKILGNRWSAIAAKLPQRTDNEIKNYWITRLKKQKSDFSSKTEPSAESDEHKGKQENLPQTEPPSKMEEKVAIDGVVAMEDHAGSSTETTEEAQTLMVAVEISEIDEGCSLSQIYDSYYVPGYDFWACSFI